MHDKMFKALEGSSNEPSSQASNYAENSFEGRNKELEQMQK